MPADRHNGLAMRAGMFLDALAASAPVDVVVIPVAGTAGTAQWARARARDLVVVTPGQEIPKPPRSDGAVVVVLRSYLVPAGLALADRIGASRTVVDLDDDDEWLLVESGDHEGAARAAGIARRWLPAVGAVTLAAQQDAARVAARHGLTRVYAVPNALSPVSEVREPPGTARLLYVGNLTYGPNIEATRGLVTEVFPSIRAARPDAAVDLVGHHDDTLADLGSTEGVTLAGRVPDVAPWYAQCDAVVVPLRRASGTRIKVLEAFAHRRPVIATPAAVAGLAVRHDVDILIADRADELAKHTLSVLDDPELGRRLSAAASATLVANYSPAVVSHAIRDVVFGRTT